MPLIYAITALVINLKLRFSAATDLETLKAQSKAYFQRNDYRMAANVLTKIIKLEPNDIHNHFQRATANFGLSKIKRAIFDLEKILQLKSDYIPGHNYLAKANTFICNLEKAIETLQKLVKWTKGEEKSENEKKIAAIRKIQKTSKEFGKLSCSSIETMSEVVDVCKYKREFLLKISDCYFDSKNYSHSVKYAMRLIKLDQNDLEGYKHLSRAYFAQGNIRGALKVTQKGLRNDPDYKPLRIIYKKLNKIKSLTEEAKSLKERKRYIKSTKVLNKLREILPSNSPAMRECSLNLCQASSVLSRSKETVKFCSEVLEEGFNSFEALKFRANAYMKLEDYEKAEVDFKKANDVSPGHQDVVNGYHTAKRKAKQAKMKNYYKILDIDRDANSRDIKKAYKKAALKWHPDRWRKEEDKKIAKGKFVDINEANNILSNESLRRRYDAGEDVYREDNQNSHPGGGFNFRQGNGQQFYFHF